MLNRLSHPGAPHPFFKKDCAIKIVCAIPSKVAIHIALHDGSFLTVYVPNVGENDSLIELDFFPEWFFVLHVQALPFIRQSGAVDISRLLNMVSVELTQGIIKMKYSLDFGYSAPLTGCHSYTIIYNVYF